MHVAYSSSNGNTKLINDSDWHTLRSRTTMAYKGRALGEYLAVWILPPDRLENCQPPSQSFASQSYKMLLPQRDETTIDTSGLLSSIDISQIPVDPPPPGAVSNFVNPESIGGIGRVIICSTWPLMIVFLSLRIYARSRITRSIGADDCEFLGFISGIYIYALIYRTA